MTYAKLFGSILGSTIWREPHCVVRVWITMLAMKDQDGIVEASIPGLADFARVTREEVDQALRVLLAPDADSRTRDHEGRRIEVVDGGWRVLNHFKYRDKEDAEERREKARKRKADQRSRDASHDVTPGHARSRSVPLRPAMSQNVTTSDTDTDTESDTPADQGASRSSPEPEPEPDPESGSGPDLARPEPSAAVPARSRTAARPRCYPPVKTTVATAAPAGRSPVAGVLAVTPEGVEVLPAQLGPASRARTCDPPMPAAAVHRAAGPDPELVARRELGDWGWAELNAIRARVATKRRWRDVRPLHPMDPGRTELAARLRECGAAGEESLRHVLLVAEVEANSKGTVEYLTGSLFDPVPWRKKLAMRPDDGARTRRDRAPAPEYAGARAALDRERAEAAVPRAHETEPPIEIEMTQEDRDELRRVARKLAGMSDLQDPSLEADPEVPDGR